MRLSFSILVTVFALMFLVCGCKTKSEIRREQEFEQMKSDLKNAKAARADIDTVSEQLREDLTRLSNVVEEQTQYQRGQLDELKKEMQTVTTRIQALEQRAASEEVAAKQAQEARSKQTFENGKRLFEEEHYDEAVDVLKGVIANKPRSEDARRAQLLVADSYFAAGDYASAALEYEQYKKGYPRDSMVATATYREAQAFKKLGKKTEAKLFYQELLDRFPKSPLAAKARKEMRGLK